MLIVKTYNLPKKQPLFKLPNNIFKHCNQYKDNKIKQASLFAWHCLSQYMDLKKVKFTKNGKPYLENNTKYFSLSHSLDKIAIAICDKPIGIDIEALLPYSIVNPLASRLLKDKDLKTYNRAKHKSLWFTKYWTQHEAWIKLNDLQFKYSTFKSPINGIIKTKIINNSKENLYILTYII